MGGGIYPRCTIGIYPTQKEPTMKKIFTIIILFAMCMGHAYADSNIAVTLIEEPNRVACANKEYAKNQAEICNIIAAQPLNVIITINGDKNPPANISINGSLEKSCADAEYTRDNSEVCNILAKTPAHIHYVGGISGY